MPGKRVKIDFGGDKGRSCSTVRPAGDRHPIRCQCGRHDDQGRLGRLAADAAGQLDGMTAFMMGKLKVEGDMSNAMQLQGVLAKLKG